MTRQNKTAASRLRARRFEATMDARLSGCAFGQAAQHVGQDAAVLEILDLIERTSMDIGTFAKTLDVLAQAGLILHQRDADTGRELVTLTPTGARLVSGS